MMPEMSMEDDVADIEWNALLQPRRPLFSDLSPKALKLYFALQKKKGKK